MITLYQGARTLILPDPDPGDSIKYGDKFVLHTSLDGHKYPFLTVSNNVIFRFTLSKLTDDLLAELRLFIENTVAPPRIGIYYPLPKLCPSDPDLAYSADGTFSEDTVEAILNRRTTIAITFIGAT
jgi:hypothetical protein